jgi:hypothetical protein
MPRGEFLYVKWRLKSSKEVYEDKVELGSRLPDDLTGYGLHFAVNGPQLYVFVVPPPGTWYPLSGVTVADYRKQHQIYPAVAK